MSNNMKTSVLSVERHTREMRDRFQELTKLLHSISKDQTLPSREEILTNILTIENLYVALDIISMNVDLMYERYKDERESNKKMIEDFETLIRKYK
jgi:hypothetical protein